jgi:hypothetical protein
MEAKFWLFDKRTDSTAVPSDPATKITIVLKEGSDIDYPVFKISNKNILKANYMQWDGNYYFITGRRYINNEYFEISCEIDVLGTYRTNIMSSSQYVLRSTNSPDYNLIDNMYPTKAMPTIYNQTLTDLGANNTGHYVLITISGNGVVYYAMNQSDFDSFLSQIYATPQEDWYDNIPQLAGSITRSVLNVTDYIIGCKWIPFSKVNTGSSDTVHLGYWTSNNSVTVYKATTPIKYATVSFTLHPTTDASKAFMNCSAYHTVQISIPGCGTVPVDYSKFKGQNSGTILICVDVLGSITATIKNASGDVLSLVSGSLGQDVPVSSNSMSVAGISALGGGVGAAVGGVAKFASGDYAGALEDIGEGAAGIASGALASIPDVVTKGSVGSYYYEVNHLTVDVLEEVFDISPQAPTQQGYPCMKVLTLDTAGYYMIKNPQVPFGEDTQIKAKIENFMRIGFYVE